MDTWVSHLGFPHECSDKYIARLSQSCVQCAMSLSVHHWRPVGYLLLDLRQRAHGLLGKDDAFQLAVDDESAKTVLIRQQDGYATLACTCACLIAEVTTCESIHGTSAGLY